MTEIEYAKLYKNEYQPVLNSVAKILIKGKGRHDLEYYLADAEDCVQEAFMALWKHKDTAIDPKKYVYKVAKTQAEKLKELAENHDYINEVVSRDIDEGRRAIR
jgi:DNA-directed RNA polymerase specialized sigma24 family protein